MGRVSLGEICDVTAGQSAPQDSDSFGAEGHPFIRAGSLEALTNGGSENDCEHISEEKAEQYRMRLFPKDTIVFAKSGMSAKIGRVYRLKNSAYVVSHLAAVIPGETVDPSYLQRWFERNPPSRLIPNEAYPSIRTSEISALKIDLPDIDEQKRIAAILDKADAIRRKRQQAIQLADEFLRSVFLDMFGDPVINPKQYEVLPLGEIADVRDGTHDSPQYQSTGYPLVTSKNVSNGRIELTNVEYISEHDFMSINKRSKVDKGDIIMPMIGTIGNPVIVDIDTPFAIKNVALIKEREGGISNIYIQRLLASHYFNFILQKENRGGTQKFISLGNIRNIPVPLPSRDEVQEYVNAHKKIASIKQRLEQLFSQSEDCFGSVSQRAFRGEL